MSQSEHSIVFVSIMVGLGITELLANLHRLIRDRARVTRDSLPIAWAFVAFLLVVNYWWGVYLGVAGITGVASAGAFLVYLVVPMVLYLICAAALPAGVPDAGLDLRLAHERERRYFFALLIVYLVATFLATYQSTAPAEWRLITAYRVVLIGAIVPLFWIRARWYHWTVAVVVAGALLLRLFSQSVR
ncbi:MAG: hypothetical protein WBO04_00895 [Steroidobacteraceae bacterium]